MADLHASETIFEEHEGKIYFNKRLILVISQKSEDAKVISYLKETNMLHARDSFGNTLLHIAAQHNNTVITWYLIQSGCRINIRNNLRQTPLMLAIENNCEHTADILLESDSTNFDNKAKNATDVPKPKWFKDRNAAKVALKKIKKRYLNDNEVIATKLIAAGWPLQSVISLENIEITKMMLDRGYQVDERERISGQTTLHVAVEQGDVKCVKLLLDYNADPNALNKCNRSPIYYVYDKQKKQSNERLEITKMLIDRGATFYSSIGDNFTFCQVDSVLRYGNMEVIEVLLQANLDLTKQNENGNNPVHILAVNETSQVIKVLEGRSFDVNTLNTSLETPLFYAASCGNAYTIEFLLKRGADVNAINIKCYSPLYLSLKPLIPVLGSYGFIYRGRKSSKSQYEKCVRILLEHYADVQLEYDKPKTIFEIKDTSSVRKLLVAHLVLQEVPGAPINKRIHHRIHSEPLLRNYYNMFKQQVQTEVYKSVTLFDVLSESDLKFERRMRHQKWISRLQKYFDECESKKCYFYTLLQKRFSKTMEMIKLRQQAACHLCQIVNIDSLIADNIVSYLYKPDMLNLLQTSL